MKITGFIPCRAGSERVVNKNTRAFGGFEKGLIELKLRQLKMVDGLDEIIVSSNDQKVLDIAEEFASTEDSRVIPIPRPEKWGNSATSMGQFITDYIANLREDGHLFWTHVTHPLVTSDIYNDAINDYKKRISDGYDSLVSATRIQKFLWRDGKPFNYDNSVEKWPRSQDIAPVFEINHAIYAMPFSLMRSVGDRIGKNPYFFEIEEGCAMDIDWNNQFLLLDEIVKSRIKLGNSVI